MKRPVLIEIVVFVTLLAVGTLLRLVLRDLPNFAPVAAIALYSGFYFRSRIVAGALPIGIMTISDISIGAYDWQMMLLVYSALVLPVGVRGWVRRSVRDLRSHTFKSVAGLLGSSLAASCLFFLLTNFGSWLWFDMYEHTLPGLAHCYAAALPFFRYTLAGDMFFACALFGGYALATQFMAARQPRTCAAE